MTNDYRSIWDGSVRPSLTSKPVWHERHDAGLRQTIEPHQRCLILVGRNSSSGGSHGARDAGQNLHEAARGLARRTGFDVTGLLPPVDDLVKILMASTNKKVSRDRDGGEFLNRFCLLDYSQHGLIVSLSAGSALKTDDAFHQPHVDWMGRLVRELRPAGIFATNFNRISRVGWQTGYLLEELKEVGQREGSIWVADDHSGEWNLSGEIADLVVAINGQQANKEARDFRRKSVRSQISHTGTRMEEGRVQYALSGGVPPGLFTYRDRRTDRMILCIDSPTYHPPSDDVQYGLPRVVDEHGKPVDQAETIRWFLREYARPEVSAREVFHGLMERRFSTHALRAQRAQGPSAYYGGPTKPIDSYSSDAGASWVRSIFDNLELYETGVLRRSVDRGDEAKVVIHNVFPATGRWGDAEDFARIRAKVSADQVRSRSNISWSWSGLPVCIDGSPGRLKPRRAQTAGGEVAWMLTTDGSERSPLNDRETAGPGPAGLNQLDEPIVRRSERSAGKVGRSERRPVIPAIPDDLLTTSILEACVAANGLPLRPHLSAEPMADAVTIARRELAQLESASALKIAERERFFALLTSGDATGALLQRVQVEYDVRDASVTELAHKIEGARRRVASISTSRIGIDVTAMSALVNGLKDPHSNRYRRSLHDAVKELTATTHRVTIGGLKGTTVEVSGLLVFDVSGVPYDMPFGFSYSEGAAFEVRGRALRALRALRSGRVARFVKAGSVHDSSPLVAELLGVDSTKFPLGACHDSRLLQLGMAATFPDAAPGEDPRDVITVEDLCRDPGFVEDFDDVRTLAARMSTLYSDSQARQWLRNTGGKYEVQALIRMSLNPVAKPIAGPEEVQAVDHFRINLHKKSKAAFKSRWVFTPAHWPTLLPCEHCGSTAAAAMRIPEVEGYLCLDARCRRDGGGVRWPRRFDQYIAHLPMWVDAGFAPEVPLGFNASAKSLRGEAKDPVVSKATKWRPLASLEPDERAAIAAAYSDRTRRVKEIMSTFSVGPGTLYDIVVANGLPPRRPTMAKWQHPQSAGDRTPEDVRTARRPSVRQAST